MSLFKGRSHYIKALRTNTEDHDEKIMFDRGPDVQSLWVHNIKNETGKRVFRFSNTTACTLHTGSYIASFHFLSGSFVGLESEVAWWESNMLFTGMIANVHYLSGSCPHHHLHLFHPTKQRKDEVKNRIDFAFLWKMLACQHTDRKEHAYFTWRLLLCIELSSYLFIIKKQRHTAQLGKLIIIVIVSLFIPFQ